MPRGRPRNISPTVDTHIFLPEELHGKVSLLLWSDVEGRVPYGKVTEFMVARIREFFAREKLDLGPYLGQPADVFVVHGEPDVLKMLETKLKGTQ
jgi:hypothetical protein